MIDLFKSAALMDIVKQTAERMRDPQQVKRIVLDPDNKNLNPLYPQIGESRWSDEALSSGYPSVLLLMGELDQLFPDENWDSAAHLYILKIKEKIEADGIASFSLYGGLAGVCFAIHQASRGGSRYQKLLQTLNAYLVQKVREIYLTQLKVDLAKAQASPIRLYDIIEGLAGIGAYCLTRLSEVPLNNLLKDILELLVERVKPILVDGKWVGGWYVPGNFQFLEKDQKLYSSGIFNLGLAHGMPGLLAFFSIALLKGVVVPGQTEAISDMANWLKTRCNRYQGAFFWKTMISFEEEMMGVWSRESSFSGKDAWCYGTPGVANTLFLAGKALKDSNLIEFSTDAFTRVFFRTEEENNVPGPSFCHGICGLLMMTSHMAKETGSAELSHQTTLLMNKLLKRYHSDYQFGFKDLDFSVGGGYKEVDNAGFLEGASGILLTLLSFNQKSSWWHAPFLVSEG